jgi:hypothetical protein
MKECEHLNGRMRDICEGTADLPLYKINAYRKSWGLDELTEDSKKEGEKLPCKTCNKKMPSLGKQAVNFITATVDHVADGMKNVSPEEQERRMSICRDCPFFVEGSERCSKCGCFLSKKTKWKSSSCPINKW